MDEDVPDMSFATHELLLDRPFQMSMGLHVVLCGMEDVVDADKLAALLRASMTVRRLHALDTGRRLLVDYIVSFEVTHREQLTGADETLPGMPQIEECVFRGIMNGIRTAKSHESAQELMLDVDEIGLDAVLQKIADAITAQMSHAYSRYNDYDYYNAGGLLKHTVFVIRPDLDRMSKTAAEGPDKQLFQTALRRPKKVSYTYRNNGSPVGSAMFAGRKGRYVVIDTSAVPGVFGPIEAPEGAVLPHSTPSSYRDVSEALLGKLSNSILSAVNRVFFPDVMSETIKPARYLLVPVFVFRNHKLSFHPHLVHEGVNYDIDVDEIVKKMQPLQLLHMETKVVFGSHSLFDYVHVAAALSRATQVVNDHKLRLSGHDFVHSKRLNPLNLSDDGNGVRSFVNGPVLLTQLLESADDLTENLLSLSTQEKDKDLLSLFFGPNYKARSSHLRLFPVFIFSLTGRKADDLFFESHDNFYADGRGAVVLQSNWTRVPLPFFRGLPDRHPVEMDASVVTGAVLEAMVQGIGNVSPPHLKWSALHNRSVVNYAWSAGSTFAGPFSSGNGKQVFSENVRENAIRSTMVATVHATMKKMQHVLHLVVEFEKQHHMQKDLHDLAADIASGEAGRMATAQIKVNLQQAYDQLWKVSQIFNELSPEEHKDLFELASDMPARVEAIERAARIALEDAEDAISCCSVKRVVIRKPYSVRSAAGWLLLAVTVVGVASYLFAPLFFRVKEQ